MARASVYTLLSLDRFAKIMGVSPVHFHSAQVPLVPELFKLQGCSSAWYQYDWQSGEQVSREHVAEEISVAEEQIARALGYYPAPVWIYEEQHPYDRPHRREYFGDGYAIRYDAKTVELDFGRIVAMGKRAVELIGTSGIAYSDEDGDGFAETATVTIGTSYSDVKFLKIYYPGHDGEPEWEIRPTRTKYWGGGIFVATFYTWQMIDPELYEEFPTDTSPDLIDITNAGNLLTQTQVYREYTDTADESVRFYWRNENVGCVNCNGAGCDVCGEISQDGCAFIQRKDLGLIAPYPATYDATYETWTDAIWLGTREPDRVAVWYYAGNESNEYKRGGKEHTDPLSNYWARIIAYMAASRLEHPMCQCANTRALHTWLRFDMTSTSPTEATFIFATPEIAENPFGTRRGEVYAWRAVCKIPNKRKFSYAAI